MKIQARFPLLAAALFVSLASPVQAGGFGGPAPFQNGSPLVSGTDGIYQCVATGKNATGIITWAISNGVQTSTSTNNSWSMFLDGDILSGSTQANISNGKVAGILDSGISNSLADTTSLPILFVVPGNSASGSFSGRIDLKSPIAAIDGEGLMTGTPSRVDQIIIVSQSSITGVVTATTVPITIPGSTLADLPFKIRGSRLSTSTN